MFRNRQLCSQGVALCVRASVLALVIITCPCERTQLPNTTLQQQHGPNIFPSRHHVFEKAVQVTVGPIAKEADMEQTRGSSAKESDKTSRPRPITSGTAERHLQSFLEAGKSDRGSKSGSGSDQAGTGSWKAVSWRSYLHHLVYDGARQQIPFGTWDIWFVTVGTGILSIVGIALIILRKEADDRCNPGAYWKCETSQGTLPLHQTVWANLPSALNVALVAIPLSMALAIASGASPMTGINTAIIAGLCVGLFGASHFGIVGPAGALVAILMRYTVSYGPEIIPWLSIGSSIAIVLSQVSGLHVYCLLMPKCVFEGFTVSIALTIGLSQVDFALGLSSGSPVHIHGFEISPVVSKLLASSQALHTVTVGSVVLFTVSTIGMLLLYRWRPTIPWMVPYAILTIIFGVVCELLDPENASPFCLPTLKTKYGLLEFQLAVPLKPLTQIVDTSDGTMRAQYMDILAGALSVAFVGILETLISAKIAATKGRVIFGGKDLDHELQGLAIAHAACGICGAMPPTGVFVPTSVNQRAGATHGTSQALQGVILLLVTGTCMFIFSYMPLAAVAAILATASLRMVPWAYCYFLVTKHWKTFVLLLTVALLSFGIDSVAGLVFGTIVSLLVTARETSRGHAKLYVTAQGGKKNPDGTPEMLNIDARNLDSAMPVAHKHKSSSAELAFEQGAIFSHFDDSSQRPKSISLKTRMSSTAQRVYLYEILGQMDYLGCERHTQRLQALIQETPLAVVLGLQNVPWIDTDGLEAFAFIANEFQEGKVTFFLGGAREEVLEAFEAEEWFQHLKKTGRVLDSVAAALCQAAFSTAQ